MFFVDYFSFSAHHKAVMQIHDAVFMQETVGSNAFYIVQPSR
jgi:hypothetical protein